VKTFDLLIAAYALGHEAQLLTMGRDFLMMQKKGIHLQLVPLTTG
jgi:predicted nucleic acid-binding protein